MAQQRIEANFSQGWGVATFIVLLVAAAFATAFTINRKTFHSPNDPTSPGSSSPAVPATEHH
jgi:hypothetical protein